LALAWFLGTKLDPVWQRIFSLGLWRLPNPPQSMAAFREVARSLTPRYHQDGAGSTVDVFSWQDGARELLSLKVNGKADAGNGDDMITQLLLGHVPMLLKPQSTQALIIGFGSGMTCAAVARHPTVQRVDAVEISPEVIRASQLFAPFNDNILTNPKLHLALED